jgi:alanyl-tRNA synthetase
VFVFGSAGKKTKIDISEIIREICSELGGKGGGSASVAQGFIRDSLKIKKIIKKIRERFLKNG